MKILKPLEGIKWTHRIIDDFFDHQQMYRLDDYFQAGYKIISEYGFMDNEGNVKDASEWRLKDNKVVGFTCHIPFTPTRKWSEHFRWTIANSDDRALKDLERQDYFSYMEINMIPPSYTYMWHIDAEHKFLSATVYIGNDGNGTTLRSGENVNQVEWKHNRALMFCSSSMDKDGNPMTREWNDELVTWHKYDNLTKGIRTTVNINFMKPEFAFQYYKNPGRLDNFQNWAKGLNRESFVPMLLPVTKTDADREYIRQSKMVESLSS